MEQPDDVMSRVQDEECQAILQERRNSTGAGRPAAHLMISQGFPKPRPWRELNLLSKEELFTQVVTENAATRA